MVDVMFEGEREIERRNCTMPPHTQLQQFNQVTVGLKRKMEEDPSLANLKRKMEEEPSLPATQPPSSYPIEFSPPRVDESDDSPSCMSMLRNDEVPTATVSPLREEVPMSPLGEDVPAPVREDVQASVLDNVPTPVRDNVPASFLGKVSTSVRDNVPASVLDKVPTPVRDNVPAEDSPVVQVKRKLVEEETSAKRLCTLKEMAGDLRPSTAIAHLSLPPSPTLLSSKDLSLSPPCNKDLSLPPPCNKDLPLLPPCNKDLPLSPPCNKDLPLSPPCNKDLPLSPPCNKDLPLSPPCNKDLPLSPSCNKNEENKENLVCLKSIAENQNFDSILAKTLLAARADNKAEGGPKVVVEPLPSIYELKMSRLEEDEDDDDDSSMFETPPKSPFDRFWTTSGVSSTTTTPPAVSTYQFLDNNQRIECDENGKSYLQLGTVNHHHLPVTPVIQPKPTTLIPRRPIPSCRPSLPRPPNPTPPCEMPSAPFYRQQRTDMLSLSLHKLHMARQRSDSSLRRSVLICNMLRYIEEESNTEARQHEAHYQEQASQPEHQPYWGGNNFSPPPTPNPYTRDNGSNAFVQENGFDAPLKDFNSAFRQSSPLMASSPESSENDEERGINWSSVLSLTSQNELDPLNNNTFNEPTGIWCNGHTDVLSDVDLSQTSFDDVSWKLSPISADEVMKAFPEENMFECAA